MQERQSNIELLRLLSIFTLLYLHFYVHSFLPSTVYAEQTGFWKNFPLVLSSLTSLQVNIFILISGWFGIHTTPKKVINFVLMCIFYGVLTYCVALGLGHSFSIKELAISFMPISFMDGWWFAKAYLYLLLLAPLFNKAIEHMSKREYIYVLCVLTLINSYYGFFCKQEINVYGGNFMQLMYVYFIGRYLALHVHFDKEKLRKWSAIFSVVSVALYAIVWIINDNYLHIVNSYTFLNRNNLWSMVNSISIFLFFTTLQFESKSINWLAKGVFPVYLIHESMWIEPYWYKNIMNIYDTTETGQAWLIVTAVMVVYFVVVLCFDHIRACITNPVVSGLDKGCINIIKKKLK